MLPIPRHLREIFKADLEKSNEHNLEGAIRCSCGCEKFKIKTFSDLYNKGNSISCEMYKGGYVLVIKGICKDCNKEWLIFDFSKHGYDGLVCKDGIEITEDERLKEYVCPKCKENSFEMWLWIEVEDKEQFIEEVVEEYPEEFEEGDYVDAFNWLAGKLKCDCCKNELTEWLNMELS